MSWHELNATRTEAAKDRHDALAPQRDSSKRFCVASARDLAPGLFAQMNAAAVPDGNEPCRDIHGVAPEIKAELAPANYPGNYTSDVTNWIKSCPR